MDTENEIEELLRRHGMVWARGKKHCVYKHPDGRSFIISTSPSDINASKQVLRSLRKFLSLPPSKPKKATTHKIKKGTVKAQFYVNKVIRETKDWQDQLRQVKAALTPKKIHKPQKSITYERQQSFTIPSDVIREALRKAGLL